MTERRRWGHDGHTIAWASVIICFYFYLAAYLKTPLHEPCRMLSPDRTAESTAAAGQTRADWSRKI